MESKKTFFSTIRELIAKDEIAAALKQLQILLENSPQLDEIIQQSARFNAIRKQIRQGIVSHEDANVTQNQIKAGLIEFLRETETQSEQPAIQQEIEQAISIVNSKNVVTGNITAAGNVIVGDNNTIIVQNNANAPAKAFNEHLTKSLIEAIAPHSKPIANFLKNASRYENWETQERISSRAQEMIGYSFVGVIGIQLSKLIAIGKEASSEGKERLYIQKCLEITKRSFDLVNFALLSALWSTESPSSSTISEQQSEILALRFDNAFEQSIDEQFELLKVLYEVLADREQDFPIIEMDGFDPYLKADSTLYKNCQKMQALNERLDKSQLTPSDCFEAETLLASFLGHFSFLVNYNMVSIKKIGYHQIRNTTANYLHRYTALGLDSKANKDAEKVKYIKETAHTNAVLFFRGDDYQNSINLYPFVIDYNTLTFEQGARIFFFSSKSMDDESLEYLFLEDNSLVNIEKKDILASGTDYNELMIDDSKRKILNMDNVVNGFEKARQSILKE